MSIHSTHILPPNMSRLTPTIIDGRFGRTVHYLDKVGRLSSITRTGSVVLWTRGDSPETRIAFPDTYQAIAYAGQLYHSTVNPSVSVFR